MASYILNTFLKSRQGGRVGAVGAQEIRLHMTRVENVLDKRLIICSRLVRTPQEFYMRVK